MNDNEHYILVNNEKTGPFTLEQLDAMVANNEIPSETLYAKAGMAEWKALSSILPPKASVSGLPAVKHPSSPLKVGGWICLIVVATIILSQVFKNSSRLKAPPLEQRYSSGADMLTLKRFTVGGNSDDNAGDVVSLELSRIELSEHASYSAAISVRGKQTVKLAKGKSVRLEIDGSAFYWMNDSTGNAKTNALGQASEHIFLWDLQPDFILALTNARYVGLILDGELRRLSVPLTEENTEWLKAFARRAAESDARIFKPVK